LLTSWFIQGAIIAAGAFSALADDPPAPDDGVQVVIRADGQRVRAVRVETAPLIDGRLDEAVWAVAEATDAFTQVNPVEGVAPTQRTEVRVLYDRTQIYFGIRCFDTAPDRIISTQMRRNASLLSDDRVQVVIDPYRDRRNGFFFEMNPAGSRGDALIVNNAELARDWDGIWFGRTTIDEAGWVAESAIPFQTISFNEATTEWGLNVTRIVRRGNEEIRWAATRRDVGSIAVSEAGTLEGIEDIDQGLGLDVKPFGVASHREDRDADMSTTNFDAGLDLFYKFTSSTTLALTFNTDFAETEVDERQINLTRFPLFFPEKRDFFLQDTGIFDFGGINRNPLPFQSRRIGIGPDGEEREILAGVKLTGRQQGLNFGILNVQMKDDEDLGSKNFTVGRAAYNVFDESSIGAIFTNGDPNRPGENRVAGADLLFRDSSFNGNRTVTGSAFFLTSETPGVQTGSIAYGFKLGYPNDRVSWQIGFTHIDEAFDAALGFVPRPGIREYFGNWRYRWRPNDVIRRIDVGGGAFLVTNLDDEIESEDFSVDIFDIEFVTSDTIAFTYSFEREVLDDAFEISDGIVIPVGDYRWDRWQLNASTDSSRPLRFGFRLAGGGFFSGDRLDTQFDIEWRASSNLFVGFEYEQNDVDLAEGSFITRIGRARLNVFFTPDLSWTTFAQYDNVSETLGVNSKVRWIIQPGNELFVVVNQGFDVVDSDIRATATDLTTKLGWTFRF